MAVCRKTCEGKPDTKALNQMMRGVRTEGTKFHEIVKIFQEEEFFAHTRLD
jgi:hypothetical protein